VWLRHRFRQYLKSGSLEDKFDRLFNSLINKEYDESWTFKLRHDDRDFNLGAVFGVEKDLPEEFLVSGADKLKMKIQGGSDLCSAYATMTASELQEM